MSQTAAPAKGFALRDLAFIGLFAVHEMSWLYEYEVLSLLRLFVDIIKIHILEVKALHSIRFGIILVKV